MQICLAQSLKGLIMFCAGGGEGGRDAIIFWTKQVGTAVALVQGVSSAHIVME